MNSDSEISNDGECDFVKFNHDQFQLEDSLFRDVVTHLPPSTLCSSEPDSDLDFQFRDLKTSIASHTQNIFEDKQCINDPLDVDNSSCIYNDVLISALPESVSPSTGLFPTLGSIKPVTSSDQPPRFVAPCSYQSDDKDMSIRSGESTSRRKSLGFKRTKKLKRYLEKPNSNPLLEKSRLNAINAKLNRERKKHELLDLLEKCEQIQSENTRLAEQNQVLSRQLEKHKRVLQTLQPYLPQHISDVSSVFSEISKCH